MARPRGSTWQASFSFKGRKYRKDGFASKGEAEEYERQQREMLEKGQVKAPQNPNTCDTLSDLLSKVTDRYWKGSKSEDTSIKNAEDCVEVLGGDRHPKSISLASIDQLVDEFRKRKLSNATINRKLASLSKMLTHAHSRGWIDRVPKIEKLKESKGRTRWYTPAEEKTILDYYQMKGWLHMRDFITFLLDTGARVSEALGARFVHCTEGYVRLYDTKNGGNRAVPMTNRVRLLIDRRRASAGDSERVFHDLDLWASQNAWKVQREALGQEKDEEWVMHTCRHTFGSRLAQGGADMLSIMQLMGHKSLSMTQRYSHLSPKNLMSTIGILDPKPQPQTQELAHA